MAATAAQIARLRRLVDEPSVTTYSDALLASYIEASPLIDARGEEPVTWDTTTTPPTAAANTSWVPTYDLNAAAAAVWEEKAAVLAADYDVTADGNTMHRSQAYEQALSRAEYFSARRAIGTITQRIEPEDGISDYSWIANRAEDDDE